MRVLVTGASGFIGRHLVRELLSRGHTVTGLVRPRTDSTAILAKEMLLAAGDVTDRSSLAGPMAGQDIVFHLAAVVGKIGALDDHLAVGVQGTRNVVDAAVAAGIPRLVHMSSCAVYRAPPKGVPITEQDPLEEEPEPWNFYAKQKLLSEQIVRLESEQGRIEVTVIRPPTVLGPGDPNLVPLMEAIASSPLGTIARDDARHFPLVVVEELVQGIADAGLKQKGSGKVYNLAGREMVTKREVLDAFERAGIRWRLDGVAVRAAVRGTDAVLSASENLIGKWNPGRRASARQALVKLLENHAYRRAQADLVIDCSRAEKELAWRGVADYRAAIQRAVDWHLGQRPGTE